MIQGSFDSHLLQLLTLRLCKHCDLVLDFIIIIVISSFAVHIVKCFGCREQRLPISILVPFGWPIVGYHRHTMVVSAQ